MPKNLQQQKILKNARKSRESTKMTNFKIISGLSLRHSEHPRLLVHKRGHMAAIER